MKTTQFSPNFILFLSVIYFVHSVPQTLRKTGRDCTKDSDCVENAYCYDGKMCMCTERYIAIATSRKTFICVKEASYIDDECLYDIQCATALGTHAECKKKPSDTNLVPGRCACKDDSHYQDDICYKNSRIGESCQVNDNCVIMNSDLVAYCDHSRCVCPPNFHPNDNGTDCLPTSVLGGPCLSDEDCINMNSRCLNVCDCKMGYVMNEEKNHCLRAADELHTPCTEDKQCTQFLPRTRCDPISTRCNCTADSHEVKGACFKSSRLHEPCTKKEECLIDSRNISRVECSQGFCLCSNEYEMINRTDCIDMRRALPDKTGTSTIFQMNVVLLFIFIPIIQIM